MAYILGDIVKYLKFDDTDIDNWIFKLYHKGCAVVFLVGSMVSIFSQYFGEPISCDFKGLDVEMATHYCWIHGSSYIPPQYQGHMKCITDLVNIYFDSCNGCKPFLTVAKFSYNSNSCKPFLHF